MKTIQIEALSLDFWMLVSIVTFGVFGFVAMIKNYTLSHHLENNNRELRDISVRMITVVEKREEEIFRLNRRIEALEKIIKNQSLNRTTRSKK